MTDNIQQFRDAIRSAGLVPPDMIEPGRFHRLPGDGKRDSNKAAWCKLFPDGTGGIFGDYSTGLSAQWQEKRETSYTPAEREAFKRHVAEAKAQAEAEQKAKQAQAQAKAISIWNAPVSTLEATQPAITNHPYLKRKRIQPHGVKIYHGSLTIGGMACNGALMIPMMLSGKITSLQFINRDGEKRFLPNGEKGGYLIGKIEAGKPICIAEGFATGASIHEATGYAVIVAFDSGNLRKLAEALRVKQPNAVIVFCSDDDYKTEGNPGKTKATEAALVVGGLLVSPIFGSNRPGRATDFNDMAAHCGIDAVKQAIDAAKPVERNIDPAGSDLSRSNKAGKAEVLPRTFESLPIVRLTCAADIKPEAIRWLWDGWLARGKLHIFAGQAGTGKTTIAIALAATVSIGGRFPDGTRAPVGNVLIWSGEDSAKDTLIPRLIAAGADMQRVHFIGDVQQGDELRSFDPATDIRAMMDATTRIGDISMLIVDPVVNAVAGDSHKNTEVRRALQPLVDFGEKLGCAVLGISHFSKGTGGKEPLERVSGSLAFGALARIVLATAKITEGDTTRRIFCRAKSNIGLDHGGYEYDLHQKEIDGYTGIFSSYAAWGEKVEGSARELLAEVEPIRESSEVEGAREFLCELLAGEAMPAKDAQKAAIDAGYNLATIKRAKPGLVTTSRIGFGKGSVCMWKLAENTHSGSSNAIEAQQIVMSQYGNHGPVWSEDAHEDAENAESVAGSNTSHLRL